MKRARAAALAVPLVLAGCRDLGLEGNQPLETWETGAISELVTSLHTHQAAAEASVIVDGRLWVPWDRPQPLDQERLRPVGSYQGATLYVRSWDRSPFDDVFAETVAGEWQGHAPVIGYTPGAGGGGH
jgi:hypothetical protein